MKRLKTLAGILFLLAWWTSGGANTNARAVDLDPCDIYCSTGSPCCLVSKYWGCNTYCTYYCSYTGGELTPVACVWIFQGQEYPGYICECDEGVAASLK